MPTPASVSDNMYNRSQRKGDSPHLNWHEQCGGRQGGMPWRWIWPTQTVACCPSQLSILSANKADTGRKGNMGGGRFVEYSCHSAPHNLGKEGERQTDKDKERQNEIFAQPGNCSTFYSSVWLCVTLSKLTVNEILCNSLGRLRKVLGKRAIYETDILNDTDNSYSGQK